jgi:adenine-specific DNA-methyltransferase
MQKLKLHSPDLTQANIDKLAAISKLFPNCVTEALDAKGVLSKSVDFDQLRQELSATLVEGPQERYQLNWPGKREALLTANAPIAKTLRPCREESVDFDTTQNLFIEGDNLDALKLLQETYLNKVKMIYIDPPYNTGNDFIYEDDFAEDSDGYLERSNQKDAVGNRMVANTESNGRFHSDWLSMIYPRLKLARNLLRDDGVIFISIDDNEVHNLRKSCDEVFGENNFVANVVWEKKFAPQNDEKYISASHDHVLVYARTKSEWRPNLLPRTEEALKKFKNPDNDSRGVWTSGDLTSKTKAANHSYPITAPEGTVFFPPHGRQWAPSLTTYERLRTENRIWFGEAEDKVPRLKQFLSEIQDGVVPMTIWGYQDVGHTQSATQELKKLFESTLFDSPKPINLIKRIVYLATNKDDVVLDFFAGSATTAHAMMQLNAEDGGDRKFIMVQLPEVTHEKSEAAKAGYKNIADISKERIRRAGKKIKTENALTSPDLDIGFRVLKIDSSNMKEVFYTPDAVSQDLLSDQVNNIREDRTAEDLLFQVLLDWGVDLSLPISQETIDGKPVFFVDDNALTACFETNINEDFVKLLAKRAPLRVVFRDAGFASDSVKINVEQIFKLMSPGTEVKTI